MDLLILLLVVWLLSPIGLGIALVLSRRKRLSALASAPAPEPIAEPPTNPNPGGPVETRGFSGRDVLSLLMLQRELRHQRDAGALGSDEHETLTGSLDDLWSEYLSKNGLDRDTGGWRSRRDEAWNVFVRMQSEPPGMPPWRRSAATPQACRPEPEREIVVAPRVEPIPVAPSPPEPIQAEAPRPVVPPVAESKPRAGLAAALSGKRRSEAADVLQRPIPTAPPASAAASATQADTEAFAFEPEPPSAIDRAIQTMSGWPRLAAPFLVQNIGWFIGGFCFVAGTLFLVSVTTGFVNASVVLASLALYTAFLIGAGYKIRHRRADLRVSGNVLLTIAMLLVPLNLTAAARLVDAAVGSLPALALALVVSAAVCVGLLWSARLVNGLMDRALPQRHAVLLLALSALQLAAPLVSRGGGWPLLALLHGLALALLAVGVVGFARVWLRSIFLDRHLVAYYSAGLLVFAALVSCVHIVWAYPAPLPRGYFGPYLMALCALLFYLDAALKERIKKHVFLSRFSFAIYALSIAALLMCFDAPATRTLTLVFASGTYAHVLWRYLTPPPLYLLLGSLGGLYGTLILARLPPELHLIASLPGLAAVFALARWAERRSASVARICLSAFGLAFGGLAAWSLYNAEPGVVAFSSGVITTAAIYLASRAATARAEPDTTVNPAPWFYALCALAAVTLAYAPPLPGLAWAAQLSFALLGLAALAAWIALRVAVAASSARTEAFVNSALVLIAVAVALGVHDAIAEIPRTPELSVLLALTACVLLWLSLNLRMRWLFYGMLAALGASVFLFKRTYFPAPSFGVGAMVGALVVWILLWRIDGARVEKSAPGRHDGYGADPSPTDFRVLGFLRVIARPGLAATRDVVRTPLRQAMVLLWLTGAIQLVARLPDGISSWKWPVCATIGALAALLIAADLRQLRLTPVPVVLGLAATIAFAHRLGVTDIAVLSAVAAAYALVIWYSARIAAALPASVGLARWLGLAVGHPPPGGRNALEQGTHWTGVTICTAAVVMALLDDPATLVSPARLGPVLAFTAGFFWLAGWCYRLRGHSFGFLLSTVLSVWSVYAWSRVPALGGIGQLALDPGLGRWTAVAGIALGAIAILLDRYWGKNAVALSRSLYREPARLLALALAVVTATQQLVIAALSLAFDAPTPSSFTLALAGAGALLANHALARRSWCFVGLLILALGIHGVAMDWIAPWNEAARWDIGSNALVMAVLALVFACLAEWLRRHPGNGSLYLESLQVIAGGAYAIAAVAASVLLIGLAPSAGSILTWLLVALLTGALPVLVPLADARRWRGVAVPLLLSGLAYVAAVPAGGPSIVTGWTAVVWGFALWAAGSLLVARWNRRFPDWALGEGLWPWLGLVFVLAGSLLTLQQPGQSWVHLLLVSLYFYLLIRNSAWRAFPWLGAATLTGAGMALSGWWIAPIVGGEWHAVTAFSMFASVLWLNLVLALVPLWRRYGPVVASRLSWCRSDLEPGLLVCAGAASLVILGLLSAVQCARMAGFDLPFSSTRLLGLAALGLLLAVSFLHAFVLAPHVLFAHGALLALLWVPVSAVMYVAQVQHVPLATALWGIALLAVAQRSRTLPEPLFGALRAWSNILPAAAGALALVLPGITLADQLLVLAVVTAHAASIGWLHNHRTWLGGAAGLVVLLGHALWLLWVPLAEIERALSWLGLLSAATLWIVAATIARLDARLDGDARSPHSEQPRTAATLRGVLVDCQAPMAALAALELVGHGFWMIGWYSVGESPAWLTSVDPLAALAGIALLVAMTIRVATRRRQGVWIYAAAVLGLLGAGYARVVIIGLAPPTVWDTAVLIGAAYALFVVQRMTRSVETLHVCLALPLLALVTLPAQLGSSHAAAALLAISVHYLVIRAVTKRSIPLYLGLLALNASVYLFVPLWAEHLGLFQLYVIPVAVTVLVLLHLHRRELRPNVLNSARLAALATLYAGATLDLFVRPDLVVFALALGLGLTSIVIGIALRIRAFMYAGVAFLVLNVGAQLVQLYPEHRLGRAVILIALGITITAGMIGFNVKREAVLDRIRVFRSDLETWA